MPTPSAATAWFPLADLLRPQGRRGELLADLLTDLPGVLRPELPVFLATASAPPADTAAPLTLEAHWMPTGRNAGRAVLKLSSANSIHDAEALAGKRLYIPRTDLPDLAEDTWFVDDLVGCTLFDRDQPVGEITGVEYATGPDGRTRLEDAASLLIVEVSGSADGSDESTEALVPFIRAWIDVVDTAAQRVVMRLPEGLLENEAD